jgi:hypothetical protein
MILSVLHTPNGNLIELRVKGGVYTTTLYQPVKDSVREIGVEEAKDWQRSVRDVRNVDREHEAVNIMDVR